MESYTFICCTDRCENMGHTTSGVTMQDVMTKGILICQGCGDDLKLVGPDQSEDALRATALAPLVARVNSVLKKTLPTKPGAYGAVPGPPVNPAIGG